MRSLGDRAQIVLMSKSEAASDHAEFAMKRKGRHAHEGCVRGIYFVKAEARADEAKNCEPMKACRIVVVVDLCLICKDGGLMKRAL